MTRFKTGIRNGLESLLPRFVRQTLKRIYWKIIRFKNGCLYLKKYSRVEIGIKFRFSREEPYRGFIGDNTIIEDFNVWNAKAGTITIGKNCWFGLYNIIMGPVDVGDGVSTGPHVSILGPRHAKFETETRKTAKTIIGQNVWISTGTIILFGVKIGDNAIIGPGSVVTKDVPANVYVCGNPARNLTKLADVTWNKSDDPVGVDAGHDMTYNIK